MAYMEQTPVMDVLPWPNGRGFSGATAWWDYVLSKDERQRLDNLMGVALLDFGVRERLLKERDNSLMAAFGLSEETQKWLRGIQAESLDELAQAIVSGS
jgi:hypothetical protein